MVRRLVGKMSAMRRPVGKRLNTLASGDRAGGLSRRRGREHPRDVQWGQAACGARATSPSPGAPCGATPISAHPWPRRLTRNTSNERTSPPPLQGWRARVWGLQWPTMMPVFGGP